MKEAFLKEEEYLQSHFLELDANLPFQRGDSIMSIAGISFNSLSDLTFTTKSISDSFLSTEERLGPSSLGQL